MSKMLVATLALLVASAFGFLVQSPPARFSPPWPPGCGDHDVEPREEDGSFELDEIESVDELRQLMIDVGGPELGEELSLEAARDAIWAQVEEVADEDIDNMCMGQLSGLLQELEGGAIPDQLDLEEARNFVWDHVNQVACSRRVMGDGCECSSCVA